MATEAVQPLKINKNSSPAKVSRPLSEIGSTEQRRNSPSYNQASRKMILHRDSSPFDSSPLDKNRSPRNFWADRTTLSPPADAENSPLRSLSPEVSKRRSSIENLKKASRVKNSSMYARETKDNYDPSSSPMIERPLNNRPWGGQLQNNVFTRYDSIRKENNPFTNPEGESHRSSESKNDLSTLSPSKIPAPSPAPQSVETAPSPRKDAGSPIRSSLVASSRFANSPSAFDPENGTWSDNDDDARSNTPRGQPRHAKSVTFQTAPPEINEYEEQTPEPSSVASGSREGSYDSYEDDEDDSFDHGEYVENEDSFDASLEDTEKTPVVLPEDWRHMSPDSVRKDLVDEYDDVFEDHSHAFEDEQRGRESPAPTATPVRSGRPGLEFRTDSGASDGSDFRPLPPIPGFASPRRGRNESPRGLAMAAERASSVQRTVATPPRAASVSKDEILRMREATMNLEDRMSLMALQESLAEVHRSQSGSRSASGPTLGAPAEIAEKPSTRDDHEDEEDSQHMEDLPDFDAAPSISRESILRNVKSRRFDDLTDHEFADDDDAFDDNPERDYAELAKFDPDVAIPSRETSTQFDEDDAAVIKQEEDSYLDLDAIPTLGIPDYEQHERESSVIHHHVEPHDLIEESEDDASRYSSPMTVDDNEHEFHDVYVHEHELPDAEGTPRASPHPLAEEVDEAFSTPLEESKLDISLPMLDNFSNDDYNFGLATYITPSPPASVNEKNEENDVDARPESSSDSVVNPPEMFKPNDSAHDEVSQTSYLPKDDFSEDESFDDAIRDSITEEMLPELDPPVEDIPERRATIKTQGKLKARPSNTPADLRAMAMQRRQVSVEVPPIPDQYRSASLSGSEASESYEEDTETGAEDAAEGVTGDATSVTDENSEAADADSFMGKEKRRQSRKQLKLDLDLPVGSLDTGSGLGLMEEFDRVMESQKRGYLMRQNTKVVVASNRNFSNETNKSQLSPPTSPTAEPKPSSRGTRSAGNSPRKSSAGEKWLTAEPWNGKARRKSTRRSSGRRSNVGVSSPVPGQSENALRTVDEMMTTDEADENAERGRLFVKVVGVKDLDLPLPRNDRTYFQLTLDNGLHCVTTANLELGKSAPVGQEFELVVLTDLEFQLTLTTKLPPAPKPQQIAPAPAAPVSPTKSAKSGSVFSRLLSSPKKRAERERKEREEADLAERQRQEEIQRKRISMKPKPTQWDLMREVVDAKTGSFARSYVSLKSHESQCFGRPFTVDVPCFNEWALEKDANVVSSVRSKRNNGNRAFGNADGAIRRPPYTIGKLELQLLYIPKPKVATDHDMPKSMSSAIREMKAAEQVKEAFWEGPLSQQGGDCPYWRRRFFKLQGTKLTAYHEATMQPRATINLSKASKLIDDRSALVADPSGGNPTARSRRKSAFAEDDEGYQFVEDGFRIRFANGETIDFYADNVAQKEEWMKALSLSVGKAPASKQAKWTDLVLAKERLEGKGPAGENDRKTSGQSQASSQPSTRPGSAPTSPMLNRAMSTRPATATGPTVPPKDGETTPPMGARTGHRQRSQVKSMIF